MKRSVQWRKWKDPLEELVETDEKIKKLVHDNNDEVDENADSDKTIRTPTGIQVLNTPFGILPLTENNIPSNNFDFWVGYTNFNITPQVVSILDTIPGVEMLDIFSRYTFRIGIGRHKDFTFRKVRKQIDQLVCGQVKDKETEILDTVDEIRETIKVFRKWAILALPNGMVKYVHTNSDEDHEFKKEVEAYEEIQKGVGAFLFTSENDKCAETG